ncbi:MAG TPA: phytanoyl-CoA dioxygenase family protein [Rhizomicrobium sp.]|nr:phytanoyl-CoA dioxygenase family protein [Rhizomicrobium sp.]
MNLAVMGTPASQKKTSLSGAVGAAAYNMFDRWVNTARRWRRAAAHAAPDNCDKYLRCLRRDGYAALPNFYDAEYCDLLIAEIDRMMAIQPEVVRSDAIGADHRVFGAERFSPLLGAYGAEPLLRGVGEVYNGGPLRNLCTLAGRLRFVPDNLGSGQGWHRDAFHFQYKAMVYLTDVTSENGPFEIFAGSHRAINVVCDTIRGRLSKVPDSRITDEQVERLVKAEPERLRTVTAPRGTVIIFDSSAIHRGAPIRCGIRYALTNYYFRPDQCGSVLTEKFAPYPLPEST